MRLSLPAGDVDGTVAVDEHVDLAADAEVGQIDSRFDGKAGPSEHSAVFVRFEIVHVRAVAVDLLADAVAGAVDEEVAVARLSDHVARGLIDFPALERMSHGEGITDVMYAVMYSGIVLSGPLRSRTGRTFDPVFPAKGNRAILISPGVM